MTWYITADERNQHLYNQQTPVQTILLVEDDTTISELLIGLISQETSYLIFTVPDGPQAPFDMYKLLEAIHTMQKE